jgi:ribosomal subunit interface protein
MHIQIRQRHAEVTSSLRAHVERRLGFALGRFGDQIGRVLVRLSDTTGQSGALAPSHQPQGRCQIDVGLRRGVRVEDAAADLLVAVDGAAERASRAVARFLDRERELSLGSRR